MTHFWVTAPVAVLVLLHRLACGDWTDDKHTQLGRSNALSGEQVHYFANMLKNERNFRKHFDNILIPRVPGTPGSEKVRQYLVSTLKELGWDVGISSSNQTTPIGTIEFHNVIATLDPDAPRRLVVACHYDSLRTPAGFLGATDSAVPCAQMLNLAHTMQMDLKDYAKDQPSLTLQLIFFDGEEAMEQWQGTDNTYGSRDLAQKWESQAFEYDGTITNQLARIDLFFLIDLVGTKNPNFFSLKRNTTPWFQRLHTIEKRLQNNFARRNPKPMFIDPNLLARFHAGIEDDHIHFERRGVPILHMISVPFPSVWHKMSDNRSAIDFKTVEDLNKVLRVFVAEYLQLD